MGIDEWVGSNMNLSYESGFVLSKKDKEDAGPLVIETLNNCFVLNTSVELSMQWYYFCL